MNQNVQPHSGAWVTFTYVSFSASAFMVAVGVFFLPLDLWIKGYLAMGIVMLVQSCVTLTKTVRDMHESGKLVNRIEDAKAERLLMEVSKALIQGRVTCDAVLARRAADVSASAVRSAARHDPEIAAVRLRVGRLKGRIDFNETTRGVSSAGAFAGRARGVDGCCRHRGSDRR